MGQISLVRLEKINTTMSWESGLFLESYQWLSVKLYLFFKFFLKSFFKLSFFKLYTSLNYFCKKKDSNLYKAFTLSVRSKLKLKQKVKFVPLCTYLYQLHNVNYVLCVYSTLVLKKINFFRVQLKQQPKKFNYLQ